MRNSLEHILRQGFGLFSLNDAASIRYANGIMYLVITPIPALNDEPIELEIVSRDPGAIRDEAMSHINTILAIYRDIFFEDIQRL